MKTPTPHEGKAGVPEARQHHNTDDLFPGLLRAFVAEVRAALPWLALGFAIGAIVQAAGAMWRAL